jgi:hypothetical protein
MPKNSSRARCVFWTLALCALAVLVSCHKQEHTPLVPQDWSTLSISVSKGWCQLTCPVYGFSVHGNGDLEYQGEQGVPTLGRRTGNVSKETVTALLTEFEKADFMALDNRFQCDHANITVSLSMDGKTKRVGTCDVNDRLTEEPTEPSPQQLAALKHFDSVNWKSWLAFEHLPYRVVTMLGIERWTTCGQACMAAVRLRSVHLFGDDAVLTAIRGKLPVRVASTGIDAYALMEAGYDVNYADKAGITPLIAATEKDDAKLVRNLLERGARPLQKDRYGRTAVNRVKSPEMRDVFRIYGNVLAVPNGD